jgi:hypothetical protein
MPMFNVPRPSWATAAVADAALLTTGQAVAVRASTTSVDRVIEVLMSGEGAASAINLMAIRRSTTPLSSGAMSGLTLGQLNPRSAAPGFGYGITYATTYPTVGTQRPFQASLNVFGGIIRWVAAPGEEIYFLGAATQIAADSELTLAAVTGTGTISSQLIVEEM